MKNVYEDIIKTKGYSIEHHEDVDPLEAFGDGWGGGCDDDIMNHVEHLKPVTYGGKKVLICQDCGEVFFPRYSTVDEYIVVANQILMNMVIKMQKQEELLKLTLVRGDDNNDAN